MFISKLKTVLKWFLALVIWIWIYVEWSVKVETPVILSFKKENFRKSLLISHSPVVKLFLAPEEHEQFKLEQVINLNIRGGKHVFSHMKRLKSENKGKENTWVHLETTGWRLDEENILILLNQTRAEEMLRCRERLKQLSHQSSPTPPQISALPAVQTWTCDLCRAMDL